MHSPVHTYVPLHMYTLTCPCSYTHIYSFARIYIHTHTYTPTYTYTHLCTRMHILVCTYSYAPTRMHLLIHTSTRMHPQDRATDRQCVQLRRHFKSSCWLMHVQLYVNFMPSLCLFAVTNRSHIFQPLSSFVVTRVSTTICMKLS